MFLARPSFSGTKEIYHESFFRSFVVRRLWRFYTQRLTQAGRWFLWPTLLFTSYGSFSLHLQTLRLLCLCLRSLGRGVALPAGVAAAGAAASAPCGTHLRG